MAISDITKPMALDETLQATNGKMDSVITKLQGIIDALGLDTSVYKPKGNITCAALVPALLIEDNLGNVYNVTDNGTTTSDFVEGAGKPIHVGDNVAIVDVGTGGQSEYKFDLLAGMVDLTNYIQKSNTSGLVKNDGTIDTKDYAEKASSATNGNLAGLNGSGNLTDSGWNGAKDTTSISGNPISISGLKANQLAKDPIITLEPIQAGSGTPSPSNIRAISGYDKIEVLSCGKNILAEIEQGTWNTASGSKMAMSTRCRSTYLMPLGSTQYTLSAESNVSGKFASVVVQEYTYSNGTYTNTFDSGWQGSGYTFTATQGRFYAFLFSLMGNPDVTPISFKNVQLEKGSSATTYVPYDKTTVLSESLGQTVYGGTLDVRTGVLTVTKKIVDLGDLDWTYDTNGGSPYFRLTSALADAKKPLGSEDGNITCDIYDGKSFNDWYGSITTNMTCCVGSDGRIYVTNTDYNDSTAFKTAMSGFKAVYSLATPFTIQLTPHEISLLSNYAYVSTNGTNIALDYHNGELASLADVSQLGETVNELGVPHTLDVSNQITTILSSVTFKAYRSGNVVQITGRTGALSSGTNNIIKIPNDLRDTNQMPIPSFIYLSGSDSGKVGGMYIDSSGIIAASTSSATSNGIIFSIVYVLP